MEDEEARQTAIKFMSEGPPKLDKIFKQAKQTIATLRRPPPPRGQGQPDPEDDPDDGDDDASLGSGGSGSSAAGSDAAGSSAASPRHPALMDQLCMMLLVLWGMLKIQLCEKLLLLGLLKD